MAINPALINTVQVKDLPPNPLALTNNFAHEVGDDLSRATIQDLVNFIKSQSTSYPYEIKFIRAPDSAYITNNFDMTIGATQGIGKIGGLWEGWAICNGNNGTDNFDGQTLIGWGANYATVGQFLGEKEHTLTVDELAPHAHNVDIAFDGGGALDIQSYVNSSGSDERFIPQASSSTGGGEPHNNMQPSVVVLIIMKLP